MKKSIIVLIAIIVFIIQSCAQKIEQRNNMDAANLQTAIMGGGCFWCTEAIFQNVIGVVSVEPGYAGGEDENPTYEEVCTGLTGHAEVIKIEYNPDVVQYEELLLIFFKTHNPTTLNRQGADYGTQYRSVIFYNTEKEKSIAKKMIKELDSMKIWEMPIVTEIEMYSNYYPAEKYHHSYFINNKLQPYCQVVISPKLEKFKEEFKSKAINKKK